MDEIKNEYKNSNIGFKKEDADGFKEKNIKKIVLSVELLENNNNNNNRNNNNNLIKEAEDILMKEKIRLNNIISKSNLSLRINKRKTDKIGKNSKADKIDPEFKDNLIIASDKYIINRENNNKKYTSIIAGYPWFLDWSRDTILSAEGLLLYTKRYDELKSVINLLLQDIKEGVIPNGYSEYENEPYYNSVDASLLVFELIARYTKKTQDYDVLADNFDKLLNIIDRYLFGTNFAGNNIFLDKDCLLSTGTPNIQNTWMDAKVNGEPVTPRNGKVVEINAMLYNAIKIVIEYSKLIGRRKDTNKHIIYCGRMKMAFEEKFKSSRGGLKDIVDDDKIRPNQLFAISLQYPIIDLKSRLALNILDVVEKNLMTRFAIRTLSKKDIGYVGIYGKTPEERDRSYHQGISWPWLNGIYFDAIENMIAYYEKAKEEEIRTNKYEDFAYTTKEELKKILDDLKKRKDKFVENMTIIYSSEIKAKEGIFGINELYNSETPYLPKGAPYQAWSLANILKIVLEEI